MHVIVGGAMSSARATYRSVRGSVVRTTALALALLASPSHVLAAATVGATAVTPASVPVGVATPVVFTARIDDATVLPGGVNLLKTNAAGAAGVVVGVMRDDGTNGDAVAGDKVFSLRV